MKLESSFQRELKIRLKQRYPGCMVKRNHPDDIQGFPDLTIYYRNKYAVLECKRSAKASKRPNQQHYIDRINEMGGYASFVYPENVEQVIAELDLWFDP